ncbi:F-box protein [Gossypium australe]|uniref:F-box protein n=1 Tax=Gossypium australe TaxID=47621 RepID=A0A5B6UMX2_9ROSI|nr:F-box protein [Gossypium australe]
MIHETIHSFLSFLRSNTLQNMLSKKRPRMRIVRRSDKYSQNAEAIANNYDLLILILVRLPVKSLLQFKSVSKTWHSIISDPEFSRRLSLDISGLIMCKLSYQVNKPEYGFIPLGNKSSTDDAPFKYLDFINHPSGLKVVQSCNGLLLCRSSRYNKNFNCDYYICNPTTKQFVMIPLPANPQDARIVCSLSLAFDHTKSPHYKVVCVRWLNISDDPESNYVSCQIEIYSSQTRSWRLSGKPFLAHVYTGFGGGVFCNGAIHWLGAWNNTSFYFNVQEEELRDLPMPPIPDDWEDLRRVLYFGESRNHLHLIEIYRPPTSRFSVYEVESDYSGWFVKYNINLDPLIVAYPGMVRTYLDPSDLHYYAFSIFYIVREANDEESYMVLHIPEKAIRYSLKDGSFKKICDLDANGAVYSSSPAPILLAYSCVGEFIQTLSPYSITL